MSTAAPQPAMTDPRPVTSDGRQRVLIVDDERDILEEMGELLEKRGLSVRMASSAAEALKLLAGDPDLNTVVSDIRMPLVDGVEMIDRAIHDPALRDRPLRFIMVTGHATLADAQRSIRASAVDFVPKPINTDQLLRAIARAAEQIAEIRSRRSRQRELAAKADAERRQRLEIAAQNVTLEALVAAARGKAGGKAAGLGETLAELADVLRRTVDRDRHRRATPYDRDVAPDFAAFLGQAASRLGLAISGSSLDVDAKHPRGLPSPPVEDAVEALLLGLKLHGAGSLTVDADFGEGRSELRLLPDAAPHQVAQSEIDPFAAEAARLAFLAAEISLNRIGSMMSIEDADAARHTVLVRLPVLSDGP